jgi:hypothetical protein
MFRIFVSLAVLALYAGIAFPAGAQQMPPPEGPPVQGNPYGAPANGESSAPHIPDAVMLASAKKVFAQLQTGKLDRSQLSATSANANLNESTIANAQHMIGDLGKPVSFVKQHSTSQGDMSAALYLVTFGNGQKIEFLYMVDRQGKVTGLGLGTPH